MSGKPASVAATRAGAPRVLVYVADPRQLEAGIAGPEQPPPPPAAPPPPPLDALYLHDSSSQPHQLSLPKNQLYRTHIEPSEQRNLPNAIFYKSYDNDGKVGVYGSSDNTLVQRTEFYPVGQTFLKENTIKIEESKAGERIGAVKRECNQFGAEYSGIDTFRIPAESRDTATYQSRCAVSENIMPPMQTIALPQGQNQFDGCVVQSDGTNCSDRELSVGKSYVNYQFLEQSVSHQSIVNQSISILNQQVGVSRGVVSDGDNGSGPQLVRTADGVVLAVLPSSVLPQPADVNELVTRTTQNDSSQTITVPLGWRRIVSTASVLYISPSGTALSTLSQLRDYLQTSGTCKCGLPCPLRPETTFNFDPKVVSKPYQPASGAELTKLCNHKRKLLATLQARAQSPATPPPPQEQKKVVGTEASLLKKKMKKRTNFPSNMSVSQLMVQRERPLHDFKQQDTDHRTISPGVGVRSNQNCLPAFTSVQHLPNTLAQESDIKQETHVQRSSHYLTVSSGWITQQENLDTIQKANQPAAGAHNDVGTPVLGTNGQIIGVNTGFHKQSNIKNSMTVHAVPTNIAEQEPKGEKKELSTQQSMQIIKHPSKEEESQIFCGLNQALTPEVMQKINEQQQIFIQQNQKQIEMAMKGFRTQLAENINHNKPITQNQYMPQAQLVIQNGAVVKTNPAKTPPWQVKRNDSNANAMTSPSPKPQKLESMEFEETRNMSEDSSASYSSTFNNNDQQMNQAMCSRVPPLPQHYNMINQQWSSVDMNKKKVKTTNKGGRKKTSATENKFMSYGNQGMRMLQDPKPNHCDELANNNPPSFMEDPNGFLAQQTVLLNNTISKQVTGVNSSFDGNQYDNSNNCYVQQNQGDRSCKQLKTCDMPNVYRGNMAPNPSPSPNHMPDSSMLSDKGSECCKGCNASMKNTLDYTDNQMRMKYMKPNIYKMEMEGNTLSPRHCFDDNPVTSSTFMDRSPMAVDSCGPIQAGTVSTSNASPPETLQPPEPSPTLSNSSRSTDTPHSNNGSNNMQLPPNCTFPMPSPAYSGSCGKDTFNSNPATPGSNQQYAYNSPGPPNAQVTGTQMMHFISNHNVNKNLMEVDNISMVGVKPGMKNSVEVFRLDPRKRIENTMPGYCPPPHLGGGPAHSLIHTNYVQTFVTTMASFSVTRDTVTSVLAGKANTATTSINASHANFVRPPPPPSNLATTYAIPNNQPDPFINSVNLPTSYPLHIAGTTAQNMISKSPLEITQNVIGSVPSKPDMTNQHITTMPNRRTGPTTPGQILISSTGQIIVSNNQMPPPPPKTTTAMNSVDRQGSNVTNVTSSVTQVVPTVGGVQPIVNQSTVVVNALPTPFVIQPPMMAVDGQMVQQNTVIPQIMTGVVSGQSTNDNTRQIEVKSNQNFVQGVAMLSPESLKKRHKKKKGSTTNITNVLQITAPQQNHSNIMVHSSPQHSTSPQFSPRGFQLSPNNNISPPMLQALTIVPGKSGTPAHIVMNGQGNTPNFGSQQIITNSSPSQQINLLQPVNLINNASGVVPNFPAFQQFIVPNLGGMVMTADGTAIIQDNSTGMPMQLQLQTVNGQNVLTPVQNPGVFTTGANGGVVIRAQNQQGKIIQSQHSPGAQFLSPNSQVMMSSPNFNGQLSPLLANLSPTNVSFNTSPHQVRPGNVQAQEFIQTNQMGQTVMVPLSPKQPSLAPAATPRGNSTFVQQNTTIVQQQTTLVSNSQMAASGPGGTSTRLSIDPNMLLTKQVANVQKARFIEMPIEGEQREDRDEKPPAGAFNRVAGVAGAGAGSEAHVRHSVSTQTLLNQQRGGSGGGSGSGGKSPGVSGSSPPDTTTHSPLGGGGGGGGGEASSPRRRHIARCLSSSTSAQAHYADTTTESPEPHDPTSSAMVQCVSSSEQDMAEAREHAWPTPRPDFGTDNDTQNLMSIPMMRQNMAPSPMDANEMHYNQNISNQAGTNQQMMPISSNFYDCSPAYKRKNDFGDGSSYRTDKIMRMNNSMGHGIPKETDFDSLVLGQDKNQGRRFSKSGPSSDSSMKVFDRHNLGSGDDGGGGSAGTRKFFAGDLVWGPVKGYLSWPGSLVGRAADGRWTVRWFGGERAPSAVPAARLLTLSEGLDQHHAARTNHRKSRKLNTLLENAIQEAMAELDKKSEKTTDDQQPSTSEEATPATTITETPKRIKKHDKVRKDKHHKKTKITLNVNKVGEISRLRSSR